MRCQRSGVFPDNEFTLLCAEVESCLVLGCDGARLVEDGQLLTVDNADLADGIILQYLDDGVTPGRRQLFIPDLEVQGLLGVGI